METAGRHFHVASRHLVDRPFGCECDWKDRLDVVVHLELGRLTLLHPALAVFEFRAVVARPTGVRIDFLAASSELDDSAGAPGRLHRERGPRARGPYPRGSLQRA